MHKFHQNEDLIDRKKARKSVPNEPPEEAIVGGM